MNTEPGDEILLATGIFLAVFWMAIAITILLIGEA